MWVVLYVRVPFIVFLNGAALFEGLRKDPDLEKYPCVVLHLQCSEFYNHAPTAQFEVRRTPRNSKPNSLITARKDDVQRPSARTLSPNYLTPPSAHFAGYFQGPAAEGWPPCASRTWAGKKSRGTFSVIPF